MPKPVVTFGVWDGDPVVMIEYQDKGAKAWAYYPGKGGWVEVSGADAFTQMGVIGKDEFTARFGHLPELPALGAL